VNWRAVLLLSCWNAAAAADEPATPRTYSVEMHAGAGGDSNALRDPTASLHAPVARLDGQFDVLPVERLRLHVDGFYEQSVPLRGGAYPSQADVQLTGAWRHALGPQLTLSLGALGFYEREQAVFVAG
jgi:hypothetical protein